MAAAIGAVVGAQAAGAQVTPRAGMRIATAATLKRGAYRIDDPGSGAIEVTGAGFTVEFGGTALAGPGGNRGVGIRVHDARNVTIRRANVSRYLWGIVLERCRGVKLVDCVASRNGDQPPGTVIDESGKQPEDQHGGGIVLHDCASCQVVRCTAQHEWDGIDVVRSNGNSIVDGDYSYNGNWGLHLWQSSRNAFRRNRAVWCTTGEGMLFQALTGWQTYDAQAVGIDHASCDNVIEDNDLRFGGDGIFIRSNEEPVTPGTAVPHVNSSDRNVLRGNDCSFSPNNAIEVDFVAGTVIENNNCSSSHYGMWLGYSRGSRVLRNTCINDTARAIEIENGQNGTFEGNVFGFDPPRGNDPLVYLRQNGRDRTPSGPYDIRRNVFYGSARCVLLRDTKATLADNYIHWRGGGARPAVVTQETPSRASESGTRYAAAADDAPAPIVPLGVRAGGLVRVAFTGGRAAVAVAELDGIPVWVRQISATGLTFRMPRDFWDRPAPRTADLRVYTSTGWSRPAPVRIEWPVGAPVVQSVSPNPARIGDVVTLDGRKPGDAVWLNGVRRPARRLEPDRISFEAPRDVVATTRYNLVARAADGRSTCPIVFTVQVPREQQPHIVSATISPTTLRVGDVLTVTFVVRNNLPVPVRLQARAAPGFTYDEAQNAADVRLPEQPAALHLRVTSDHPGSHEPASWPWLFGFGRSTLASGETVTVTGRIRVRTPGVHEFRVGLVEGGFRFIDDNAFRTMVTVVGK